MQSAFRLLLILGLVALLLPPVLAQESSASSFSHPSRDANRSMGDIVRLGIGLPDSLISIVNGSLNSVRQLFLRFPRDQVTIIPDPAFSTPENLPMKLKSGLNEKLDSSEVVRVNIIVYPKSLEKVSSRIEFSQGNVIESFLVGNIITAEIPRNQLLNVAAEPQVQSIWPDRDFHMTSDSSVSQIHASTLWNAGYTGTGQVIAVLDTGIDGNHPMLQGKVVNSISFTGDSVTDSVGHGTHVAGIIAGKKTGVNDFNGVAPDAKVWNVKVLDNTGHGAESWIVAGINYAVDPDGNPNTDDGVKIINMSLGGPYTDPNSPIVAAVESAVSKGVTVIIASGNCGPGCPSVDCQGFVGVETPGDAPGAITVGAVDSASQWACFSGGGLVSNGSVVKPDVVAPGVNVSSSYLGGGVASLSGTSMATPHVSGLVALLLQANPGITPQNVKSLLEQTAVDFGDPGKDTKYGSGMVDAQPLLPSSVLTLLKYSLSLSAPVLDEGAAESFTIQSTSDDVYSIYMDVNAPNGLDQNVSLIKNGLQWTGTYANTALMGTYTVHAHVENLAHDVTALHQSFVVKSPSTTGQILGQNLPAQVGHNQLVDVNVQFQNTGTSDTEVVVELQEWKGDYFEKIRFSDPVAVPAGQTATIPVSWTPQSSLGSKTIKLVATFDSTALEVDQNVSVLDSDIPIIWSISSPSSVTSAQPILVEVSGGDFSPLNGVLHVSYNSTQWDVPLRSKLSADYNQSFFGIIEPVGTGNYSYTVEFCDSASPAHCTMSPVHSFVVNACVLPQALVVLGSGAPSDFNFLANSYCLGFWGNTQQTPSLSFVNAFPLLYWYAGPSYGGSPDENAVGVLQSYSGNLFLEGDEVALRLVGDSFLSTTLHASFDQEYLQSDTNGLTASLVVPHAFTHGLSFPLTFTQKPISPDGINPENGGVGVVKWDANAFAIVADQNGSQKHVVVAFDSQALSPLNRQTLIQNLFDWSFVSSGPDVVVKNILSDTAQGVQVLLNTQRGGIVGQIPHFLSAGSNSIPFTVKNEGTAPLSNLPVEVRVDGNTGASTILSSLAVNESKSLLMNVALAAGDHNLTVYPNPSATLLEFNTLNNPKTIPVWVAPSQANAVPTGITGSYSNNKLTLSVTVSNLGGTGINSIPVQINMDGNVQTLNFGMFGGQFLTKSLSYSIPKKNVHVSVNVDPSNIVAEAKETDNQLGKTLYFCTKPPVLVVNDDDTTPFWADDEDFDGNVDDLNASSALVFDYWLKENGYCSTIWNQSTQGVPEANVLSPYSVVIWTAGDYWNTVLDTNDMNSLSEYAGNIWIEGNDVGFDHSDDGNFNLLTHADYNGDVFSIGNTIPLDFNSSVFPGLTHADFNLSNASFPDAYIPLAGGFSAADWNNGKHAMIGYIGPDYRALTQGFSLDSLSFLDQNALVTGALKWLLLSSNQGPSAPSSLMCDGSACQGHYSNTLSLTCGGSVDPEGDAMEYHFEANLPSASSGWWDGNWVYRLPVTINMSGAQSSFRTSIDIDHSLISSSSFWSTVKADFSDVRFVRDGVPLEYYRTTYADGNFASFWVEFDANEGPNTIQIYWGNPTATYIGRTNPTDFFLTGPWHLVDDFDDGIMSGWTVRSGVWDESNGIMRRISGALSEDQVTKDWLQRGSSFYIRAQARPTSACVNTEIAITRDTNHAPFTYLDEYFGMNADNACPDPNLYALLDLDHATNVVNTGNTNPKVLEDNKTEVLISRTGWMGAFISDANAAPFKKVVGWEDANHWYPYLSIGNHGGGPSEADEIYTGNGPGHAYDLNISFGQGVQTASASAWQEIGSVTGGPSFSWSMANLGAQSGVGLRCRVTDPAGSQDFSGYYQADQNISLN